MELIELKTFSFGYNHRYLREGLDKIVDFSTEGLPPPLSGKKMYCLKII